MSFLSQPPNPPGRHYNEKTEANTEVCALCAATPKALV